MPKRPSRSHIHTLRGVGRMAVDATTGVTDLVHALHTRIARAPTALGGPVVGGAVNGIADLVYGSVKGVTRAVGSGLDGLLRQLAPLIGSLPDASTDEPPGRRRAALLAALNGVLGDYLEQTHNPLAIDMRFRHQGVPLTLTPEALRRTFDSPSRRLVILLHGLCMNDLQWDTVGPPAPGHDHGAALARELGASSLYLHYNSGQHISTNGQAFAVLLDDLVAAWPVEIKDITLLGHSMGGLVARSALHYGVVAGDAWPRLVRQMVFLGTPHHGAPLERGGHWIDTLLHSTGYTAPFGRLGRVRSAGITDLRHGSVLDEDWLGHDRFAHGHDMRTPVSLPKSVQCYAVAATTAAADVVRSASGPSGPAMASGALLPGDGLVPVDSALGRHADPRFALEVQPDDCWIAAGTRHLELLSSPAVYQRVRDWLAV
ncbi:MAG: esterase/lipase family protein [Burkholderiaceae bacterium]